MYRPINSNRLVIKQSDKLSFASYSLSLVETKFLAFIIAQIDKDDSVFCEYEINKYDFETLINARLDYRTLKNFAKTLQSKVITLQNDEQERFTTFNWFHHLSYENGIFKAQLHDYLKPLLLNFQTHFGKSSLLYIARMKKSQYTSRFYYMFCSYKAQYQNSFDIELTELYRILELKDSLTRYNDFKRKILTSALEEINTITDLETKYTESQKIGKKVTHLRFEFLNKEKNLLDFT